MTNITQQIRDFLNKNPFIAKGLSYGIINVRALAFYILKKSGMDASLHAVMSAIRRYEKEIKEAKEIEDINIIFRDSKISTKSRLLMLTVKRHFNILRNVIPDIIGNTHVSKGEVLRIVEGRESIKFIIDHSKKHEIIKLIPPEELIEVIEDLGEINIHFSEKYEDMLGLISPVLNELAVNDINLVEIIGCMPELIIIVKQDDISKCHDALLRFFYSKK